MDVAVAATKSVDQEMSQAMYAVSMLSVQVTTAFLTPALTPLSRRVAAT